MCSSLLACATHVHVPDDRVEAAGKPALSEHGARAGPHDPGNTPSRLTNRPKTFRYILLRYTWCCRHNASTLIAFYPWVPSSSEISPLISTNASKPKRSVTIDP